MLPKYPAVLFLGLAIASCRPVIEDPVGAFGDVVRRDTPDAGRPARADAGPGKPQPVITDEPVPGDTCQARAARCDASVPVQSGLLPYSAENPILYSNDHPEDVHTDVLMMAMHSNGSIDLRAIVTDQQTRAPSGCSGDGCHTAAIDDGHRREWSSAARQSGFQNVLPSSTGDAAVKVIVDEARAASPELPLVIMVGGPLTLVAKAYERDPSIAANVIVSLAAFSYNDSTRGKYRPETNITVDPGAARTVFEHLRVVVVPFVDFNSDKIDETRYPATPLSRVKTLPNTPLRARMESIYAYPWAHYDADGGPQSTLLSADYARALKPVRWAEDSGGPYLADAADSDDLVITEVNGGAVTEAWWREVSTAFGVK